MRTIDDLRQLQALPLSLKVRMTQERIRSWVREFGETGVYVSFSGGKDSTVLLHLVREMYPDVPAVFCDTGLEYPEIRDFVKCFDNVTWLKPKMNFRQVIVTYGYPFISKEVSSDISEMKARIAKGLEWKTTARGQKLLGTFKDKDGNKSMFNHDKWLFLMYAPYNFSSRCCYVMKKSLVKKFAKENDRVPITGQMANESALRTQAWLKNGCNAFESKNKISNPMAFWLENDVLQYIKENEINICPVYGQIVEADELPGQMNWSEYAGFDIQTQYKTTGCARTGCMFCGYGCHLEKPGEGRFERMKKTHPKQYEYIMKPWDKGGLGYKEVIDWLNENGNLNIRY